ncbi:hypothetical protein DAPPUDRAFT_115380 [Daphnia pulex]|uniref:Paraneoplastic antigen Ma-like C-terminal domain-containing protein n=1 Tax=Daphnia pulex TaxID=6669 RepID=E9HL59_DAPPU|nr:hypothetical protein DAPPUDRAFT_115380 [Daphnia pulex]|eukprot:EFX67502.1 hypothetical protein DAPPUDRAFT_115380 [Daphnia pulex]
MLNNDVFGARPKLVRTPIISVLNPLYNVVEVEIHAPPVSPIPSNSVVSDCQESFANIVDSGSAKLIQDPVRKIQGSTDKELRTRVYSEIQKKLRSYSGYQQVDPLLKTPPHRQWIREEKTVFKSSDDVSSPLLPYLTDSSTPKSSRRITPIIDWTSRLSNFFKEKTTNGRPFRNSIEQISSGTNRNSDSKNSRRSNTRAECSLSESSSSTSIFNPSFEELKGKKDRLSKKQPSSLDAITSVIPEYSGVGHRVGADRSISGDEVSRDNNRIIEIPTRANPARAEGSKRTSPGNQAVDGSTIKLREENIDIPSGGNSVSSRTSSVCTKKRRTFPKLFSKPGNTKGRRGRRLSHGSSRNWRSVLLRARKFYKFTRQFSEKYSSPLHVSELSLQIGTSTITQSGAIGNTQAGADQSIEQIKSASPSQEVLTQNIYPGVRIIDQENEEEFEEINFISSFSFRGTSPESEQAEPSAASDLSAFQKDQYVRSSLQSLSSFSGGALQRFDTWLETFEAIMYDSDMTEKDTILELYKKMTDKAHRTMKYILHSGNDRFEAIKEKLLDHFHGDETTEKSLKKFKKANRKSGEKIYDFAIRLKELFRYAYPKNYEEDSFQIIIKEKLIDGIDEKLQMKVKYKEFRTFDELVAATRKYSVSMEAFESNKERHEFVNAINQTSHPNNSEIQEIKQIVREQHETVNAIASALKQGNKQAEETATDQSEIANCIQELSKAVSFLLTKDGKQQHVQKQALFDTGAARSVMHYNLFQSLPQRSRGTCSKLDFDLYDVHDKKLNTFGQVILPIYYGDVRFFQNFVISDGISEDCILGWEAIRKHGFTINGENQSIYLAREEPDQQKGTSGSAPEMTITASQQVKILQQSVMVIQAKMKRSFPYVSPKATVVFTSNKTLPGGLVIRDFVSTVSNDGKYSLLVENHSMHSVCLPRSSQLGTIEIASSIIGKVKIDNDSSLGDKTQVWLNCEDPEKGNMDNDNKLRDKTQVWLNCEDPDKVEIDNDSSLGDKTHDCLRQYYEDPESFKEPQGYSRRNIVAADFFCEPKDFSRRILTVSENIDEPEVYPRRSLVASESLKEPKVDLRRSFEATDFFCKPMEVAEDLKEPTFYIEVPKDLNSDLSLDLRSSDYLKQSKKIETENAIANEEKERSGKNPEVDSFEFPDSWVGPT